MIKKQNSEKMKKERKIKREEERQKTKNKKNEAEKKGEAYLVNLLSSSPCSMRMSQCFYSRQPRNSVCTSIVPHWCRTPMLPNPP
jgi:hypothetical protein